MNLYRFQLALHSALATPLAADTLWGHVAWAIRHRHGSTALADWLDQYDRGQPPLVISDPLPAGFWPRPAMPPLPLDTSPPNPSHTDALKTLAKRPWISHQAWQRICNNLSPHTLQQALADDEKNRRLPPAPIFSYSTHAAINRLTGGTAQAGGGTLFTIDRWTYPPHTVFDLWACSPHPIDTVRQWLEDALLAGYGKHASRGFGHLSVHSADPQPSLASPSQQPNALLLLASAVPAPGQPARGLFRPTVRCGRLGGDFALGPLPQNHHSRQKYPFHALAAGSLLLCDSPPRTLGRLLRNVHPCPDIRHYALACTLPCRLDDSLLLHPLLQSHHASLIPRHPEHLP